MDGGGTPIWNQCVMWPLTKTVCVTVFVCERGRASFYVCQWCFSVCRSGAEGPGGWASFSHWHTCGQKHFFLDQICRTSGMMSVMWSAETASHLLLWPQVVFMFGCYFSGRCWQWNRNTPSTNTAPPPWSGSLWIPTLHTGCTLPAM